MTYRANKDRYDILPTRRCGDSGLILPMISLGLWQNFGKEDSKTNYKKLIFSSFDNGIYHFDIANNYGPPAGFAEQNFGDILHKEMSSYRDELIISTKAGFGMWDGPFGNWGSKKYLISSLHQSLKRLKLDYVDIFYHHRHDPNTNISETMTTLDLIVKQGKSMYIGLSNYPPNILSESIKILKDLGTPFVVYQPEYSMLDRGIEKDIINLTFNNNIGCAVYSPLSQGILSDKYLQGIPKNSRAEKNKTLKKENITEKLVTILQSLNEVAKNRNQKLAEMALSWVLYNKKITSVIIGASKQTHILDAINSTKKLYFSDDEINSINEILFEYESSNYSLRTN